MNATQQKIKLALENSEEWIAYLATKSEKDLERRLNINHLQYQIAIKEKKEDVGELLNIMERIIIEARIYKAENNIADVPTEIELAILEMEIIEAKTEKRKEVISEVNTKEESISEEDSNDEDENTSSNEDTQLSFF